MNRLMLLAAGMAALSLTACDRSAEVRVEDDKGAAGLRTISRLDCPEEQGHLTRVSASPDGLTCAYRGEGAEVTLRLAALTGGDAQSVLAPIEAELKGLIPAPKKETEVAANAEADTGDGGKAEINFPGLHIKADNGGANIQIGNIKIDADEGAAEVRVGQATTINANDSGAEIRTARTGADAIRATYILASENTASGYEVAGYEARGPKAGPIVVAVVKADEAHKRNDLFDDMKDLVERNVGE
jgi:hypothetical protein